MGSVLRLFLGVVSEFLLSRVVWVFCANVIRINHVQMKFMKMYTISNCGIHQGNFVSSLA